MDNELRNFKNRQTIASIVMCVGVIPIWTPWVGLQIFGGLLIAGSLIYLFYQILFQRDLNKKNMKFNKDMNKQRKLERTQESSTARDVRRIKLILTCMSAAFAFFVLAIAFTFFINQ